VRRIARLAAAVLLTLSGPAVAAAVAYDQLNQEWWTTSTSLPAAAPARPKAPVPAPSPQAAPQPPRADAHPRDVGSCVTPAASPTACTSGALRVVASIHATTGTPCHDTPETTHTRRVGEYTLCLAAL
jgi:hypothetical protein